MAAAPRQASANGLEPRVGGNGEYQGLTQGMEQGPPPALAEAVGHGEAEGEDDGHLDPKNRIVGKPGQKQKGPQENGELQQLKKNKRCPPAVKGGV
jgi:hypothetical protein